MKPSVVADEMFPEGAGPYMDLEEVVMSQSSVTKRMCTADPNFPKRMRPTGPDFEEWCLNMSDNDDDDTNESMEDNIDVKVKIELNTDFKTSESDYEENANAIDLTTKNSSNYVFGRDNRFKWSKEPPLVNKKIEQNNIDKISPGLTNNAKALGDSPNPEEVWNLLFTNNILTEIMMWTNKNIEQARSKYKIQNHTHLCNMDLFELKAFLGLLIYTEIYKLGNENLDSFYTTDGTGRDIFRATMPKRRFEFLLCCLSFDNPDDRKERIKNDPAAAINNLFEMFIENCQKNYIIGAHACIDEMLVAFRGKCRFKIYMPKKPRKYGIRILCLTDALYNYLLNGYIYSGKGSDGNTLSAEEKHFSIPSQSVIRLVKPIERSNRNVTADNWFSSVEVVKELQKRGLTFLGTLKKNKKEIPVTFLPSKSRPVESSLYGFYEDITLLSYVPKKSKAEILISSMHHSNKIDPSTGKPEIVTDYNLTKRGVNSLDQKCANYSPCRRTRRWSIAIFFQMLNISTVNAFILFQNFKHSKKIQRMDFLKSLAKLLTIPYLKERLLTSNIRNELRFRILGILGKSETTNNDSDEIAGDQRLIVKKTCHQCPRQLKRKSFYVCRICRKPICMEHIKKMCSECCNLKLVVQLVC